jgi:hypothetical protein
VLSVGYAASHGKWIRNYDIGFPITEESYKTWIRAFVVIRSGKMNVFTLNIKSRNLLSVCYQWVIVLIL